QGPEFLETFTQAEEHALSGKPQMLLEVKLPLPFVITAAGYLEKYGPDERYNFLKFVTTVACPTLITLGSVEVANNMAFRSLPETLGERAEKHRLLRVEVVEGADHFYTGVRDQAVARVEAWLCSALH